MAFPQFLRLLRAQGGCSLSRDCFGGTFLDPMARKIAAQLRWYPNHVLSALTDWSGFGRDLPSDIQTRSDLYLHCHTATCELLPRNPVSRNLFLTRRYNNRITIGFQTRIRRVELNDVVACLEIRGREATLGVRSPFESGFAASVGYDHVYWRDCAKRRGSEDEKERRDCAADQILHMEPNYIRARKPWARLFFVSGSSL